MNYFVADIKKIYSNKLIQVTLFILLIISIADPMSIYFINGSNPNFFTNIGKQPYQFWLLMNSSGWGYAVFMRLMLVFPVISTGLIYFHERNSSLTEFLMIRGNKKAYYFSKISSVFVSTFINFLIILLFNLIITFWLFDSNSPKTDVFYSMTPKDGTFAMFFFQISPFLMGVVYTMLNALTIATMAVFALSVQMVYRFRNLYLAFIVPFGILFSSNYVSELFLNLEHKLSIINQPRAASAVVNLITFQDVILVYIVTILIVLVLCMFGIWRNKEII